MFCRVEGEKQPWLIGLRAMAAAAAPGSKGQVGQTVRRQTQGKIERWHQTLKNRILLKNYYLPGALEQAIGGFIDHDNNVRCHESLGNITPADAHYGCGPAILEERRRIKERTLRERRLLK
nr:integrase core domain-containing protein [Limibaculum sp. NKW23]